MNIKPLAFLALTYGPFSYAFNFEDSATQKFISQKNWDYSEPSGGETRMTADILPVVFSTSPRSPQGCGFFWKSESGLKFEAAIESDPEESGPECIGIYKNQTSFDLLGTTYFVYIYGYQDPRDTTYDHFFFWSKNSKGVLFAEKALNLLGKVENRPKSYIKKTPPHNIWYTTQTKDGVALAKSHLLQKHITEQKPGYVFAKRDFISDTPHSFSIFLNPKTTTCLYVTESAGQLTQKESKNCSTFLASGKLDQPEKTYFFGIYKDTQNTQKLEIFSIDKNSTTVNNETQLAQAIVQAGKQTDIKSAKKFLSDIKTK